MQQAPARKRRLRESQALEYHPYNNKSCGYSAQCTDIFNCPFAHCPEEDLKVAKPAAIGQIKLPA